MDITRWSTPKPDWLHYLQPKMEKPYTGSDGKVSVCNAEDQVRSLDWEDPLEKEMAAYSSILAWKIAWIMEPGRLPSMGSQRVGHDWATSLHFIQSAKKRPGANCCSDHELLIAKLRFKLKKVGKTTRAFRYDLNQIPYDYTAEVRNGFTGLDLIGRVPDEL